MSGPWLRRCVECGRSFEPTRRTQRYDFPSCRLAAWRRRHGLAHGWGGAIDRRARRATAAGLLAVSGHAGSAGGPR